MPEAAVKVSECAQHRKGIYSSIFPRWAAVLALGLVMAIIGVLFTVVWASSARTYEVKTKVEVIEEGFTVKMDHFAEGQHEIKEDLKAQRELLRKIEKAVNGD